MSPTFTDFVFEAVNFLLLTAALGWLSFNPVRRALDAERERHAKAEEEVKRQREAAEALANEARQVLARAAEESEQRRRTVLATAQREASDLLDQARATRRTEQQRFERELASKRDAEAAALAEAVGRIAAESVLRMLREIDGPALDVALVRMARPELERVPSDARKAAVVECARPLDDESRRELSGALGEGFKERVVDALGAGVRVTTPAGQVDATALSLARRAALAVKNAEPKATEHAEVGHA